MKWSRAAPGRALQPCPINTIVIPISIIYVHRAVCMVCDERAQNGLQEGGGGLLCTIKSRNGPEQETHPEYVMVKRGAMQL